MTISIDFPFQKRMIGRGLYCRSWWDYGVSAVRAARAAVRIAMA